MQQSGPKGVLGRCILHHRVHAIIGVVIWKVRGKLLAQLGITAVSFPTKRLEACVTRKLKLYPLNDNRILSSTQCFPHG